MPQKKYYIAREDEAYGGFVRAASPLAASRGFAAGYDQLTETFVQPYHLA